MITLGIHKGPHDSSVALLEDGKVLFHLQGERLSNIKYDHHAMQVLNYVKKYTDTVDNIALTGFDDTNESGIERYILYLSSLSKTFTQKDVEVYKFYHNHHEMHAATAFYNSGFDSAAVLVIDGMGSEVLVNYSNESVFINNKPGRETASSFTMKYPNKIDLVQKQITINYPLPSGKTWINDEEFITNSFSEAKIYEMASFAVGLTEKDSGKTMGLAPYGIPDEFNEEIYKDGVTNKELFIMEGDYYSTYVDINSFKTFQDKANFAYKLQKDIQDNIVIQVLDLLSKTKEKNICLSGGFFLNCVSNYNLLKNIPNDINVYVEPMCSDIGNSVGAAKYLYHTLTRSNEKNKQKSIYYGPKHNYSAENLKNEKTISVSAFDIAKLISEKNIVAIYQGSSESGPRALGNRSILYDPRDPNGKDHVNIVKKREWFRPFAGSVLKENAKEWFDLVNMDESKFMMFAVDVIENKKELIPAITHVDGTCRIQTVAIDDNPNFYELINEFYKITGVPILFNTSFNLAGNTIVETLDDALWTLHNSDIMFLYLPELGLLVTK
jgi:carbamoyltransferase